MKKKTIGIFTPYSLNPVLVRLESFTEKLALLGYSYDVYSSKLLKSKKLNFLNGILFWYFDLISCIVLFPKTIKYKVIYIQDLKLLPLVVFAKLLGKKVIYETLDNNVYLHTHHLRQKFKIPFYKGFSSVFSFIERVSVRFFANDVIVNSKALSEYFNHKCHVLFYTSPFEKSKFFNSEDKPEAFLFLGLFSSSKGANEILQMVVENRIPLFLFGDVPELEVQAKMDKIGDLITVYPRISSSELKIKITALLEDYFLLGFSLIKPVNKSYATQEANKDIDYLAIGIPIIGNKRIPTFEKIEAGCGILADDPLLAIKIKSTGDKKNWRIRCTEYYAQNYSNSAYEEKIRNLLTTLCRH